MYQSHEGLSTLYEVSCAELDFMVNFAKQFKEVLGSRMMGGGFGGCTLNVIESSFIGTFISQLKPAYKAEFGHEPDYYVVKTANGASLLTV
jgi:galactokinase